MFCDCSNANQIPINTITLKDGLSFVCDGLDLFSWISQSREGEGREIDEGFALGFMGSLQIFIWEFWCTNLWEIGLI